MVRANVNTVFKWIKNNLYNTIPETIIFIFVQIYILNDVNPNEKVTAYIICIKLDNLTYTQYSW